MDVPAQNGEADDQASHMAAVAELGSQPTGAPLRATSLSVKLSDATECEEKQKLWTTELFLY